MPCSWLPSYWIGKKARPNGKLEEKKESCARIGNDLSCAYASASSDFFGPDSTQYAQAGGTRTSDRKRPVREAKKVAALKAA